MSGQIKLKAATLGGDITLSPTDTASNLVVTIPAAAGELDRLNRAGNVLQVVSATYSTETTTTSLSFVATGLSASITPSSASSKILVIHNGTGGSNGGASKNGNYFTIFRGTISDTNLGDATDGLLVIYSDNASTFRVWGSLTMIVLDSPSTTSAQTYTVAMRSLTNQSAIAQKANVPSVLTLMEIAG